PVLPISIVPHHPPISPIFYPPIIISFVLSFFFFNDTATTEIYTLSLHDALPISTTYRTTSTASSPRRAAICPASISRRSAAASRDRKSTRLNSSHRTISYAVFCLKKKKKKKKKNKKETQQQRNINNFNHVSTQRN